VRAEQCKKFPSINNIKTLWDSQILDVEVDNKQTANFLIGRTGKHRLCGWEIMLRV